MHSVNLLPQILGLLLAAAAAAAGVVLALRLRTDSLRERDMTFLQIVLPKKESKEDKETGSEQYSSGQDFKEVLGLAEHLMQSIHSMVDNTWHRFLRGQPFFSVEYAALRGEILTYIVCPRSVSSLMEKQVTSFYPDAIIDVVEDYDIFTDVSCVSAIPVLPHHNWKSSFKTYQQLKSDPLNTITNAFSKLSKSEGAAVQIVLRPVRSGWQRKLRQEAQHLLNPKKKSGFGILNPLAWVSAILAVLTTGNEMKELETKEQASGERVSQQVEEYSKVLDEKASGPGFDAVLRIVSSADTPERAHQMLNEIAASFSQFDEPQGNSFHLPHFASKKDTVLRFIRRAPRHSGVSSVLKPHMRLGTAEVASLWHLPNIKYNKVETIKWQKFKLAPSPKDVPDEGLFLGYNTYRGDKRKIFMKNEDRFRHFYIIGQTGTGKSSIIQLMARQDFHNGKGVCVVDPHGSLIEDLLPYIPRERADDVIYFNPADTERPMGLNILEAETPEEKDLVALDTMNMMVKMFGEEIFGPRIQDYFRNGCLTLMEDTDEGGAITDLIKLFTDEEWQKYKVAKVKNPIVRAFWEKQMAMTGQREKQEMIPYFAAKFGQFYTNALIRNIVGQTKSAFDISKCMQNGKILLMNLSKGLVGDINSQLLGLIIVNKIQVAAMRRQRQASGERKDFYLYIDEFQNFVTPSIESILSEARKYRLGLILAHQYIDQLEKESKLSGNTSLKGAVFGNVGTMMFYKIGPQDAETGAKEMAPVFSEQDLVNMDAFKGAMKLCIDGQPSRPFTIEVPRPWVDTTYPKDTQAAEAYKQLSRLTYGRAREFVDREILRRIG